MRQRSARDNPQLVAVNAHVLPLSPHNVCLLHLRWLPEGPGYEVFKSVPPIEAPPSAPLKKDEEWRRATVEATIRQWFPYMALSQHALERVKQEWNSYFQMPKDMSAEQTPDSSKLHWKPLPKHIPQNLGTQTATFAAMNPSVRLENPPVDPTYGCGRTTAMRDREAAQYRAQIRSAAQQTHTQQAVFQADYLLVQLPGCPLALHTVSNGMSLQSAEVEDVMFTTLEYEHQPQVGVHGFWGTFRKKENQNFDPKNAKSGSKFVRHQNVSREHIVLYDVAVWMDKTADNSRALRICLSSLEKLARLRPQEWGLPDVIPVSHKAQSQAARQAQPNGTLQGRPSSARRPAQKRKPPVAQGKRNNKTRRIVDSSEEEDSVDEESMSEDQSSQESSSPSLSRGGVSQARVGNGKQIQPCHEVARDKNDAPPRLATDSSSDSDEVAPIPEGFEAYEWDGGTINHFILWSCIGNQRLPSWHVGRVTKKLSSVNAQQDGFTHDARFEGERYPRGTTLAEESARAGTLVLIRRRGEAASSTQATTEKDTDPRELSGQPQSVSDEVNAAPEVAGAEQNNRNGRPKRSSLVKSFCCHQCKASGEFLYCDPTCDDADQCAGPKLRCAKCAPAGWVNISYTDYVRAFTQQN